MFIAINLRKIFYITLCLLNAADSKYRTSLLKKCIKLGKTTILTEGILLGCILIHQLRTAHSFVYFINISFDMIVYNH